MGRLPRFIARNLKAGGRATLQFISIDTRIFDGYARSADFIETYIFPGGCLLDEPRFEAPRANAASVGLTVSIPSQLCRDFQALARALQ